MHSLLAVSVWNVPEWRYKMNQETKMNENEYESSALPADIPTQRKQLLLFLLIAYGVTYAMGLLTWYGLSLIHI